MTSLAVQPGKDRLLPPLDSEILKALANLSANGKIIRKIGDGSYVNDQVFVNNTGRALSFTEDMEKNGKVPGSQVLNFKVSRTRFGASPLLR